jgi:hypothetical protein
MKILTIVPIALILFGVFFACSDTDKFYLNEDGDLNEISGSVQKGPLLIGSSIHLYELDEDLNQTGISFQTETRDNRGSYALPAMLSNDYIEVFAEGYYFDEITGIASSAPITLSAFADITESTTININILSTLAKPRIRELMQNGYDFQAASAMAGQDVMAMFGIDSGDIDTGFSHMQMLEWGADNAFLLAASALLMQVAHDTDQGAAPTANLSETIATAGLDIAADGQLDSEEIIAAFAVAGNNLDLSQIRTFLESEYPGAEIPEFESYFPDQEIRTGIVSGSVLSDGQGLGGVEILLRDDASKTRYRYTDNVGYYRFTGVPAGTFQVIPSKTEYRFVPRETEIVRTASENSIADFEAISTAKVVTEFDEFLNMTGENSLIDFEHIINTGTLEMPGGELLDELVLLKHEYWFGGEGSPPTFALCNNYGFVLNLPSMAKAMAFNYAPFAGDAFLGQTLIEWTLFDDAGETIETANAIAIGFVNNVDHHFFGIISPQPFRSVSIRRIRADGTDGISNWMIDDIRWATEVK